MVDDRADPTDTTEAAPAPAPDTAADEPPAAPEPVADAPIEVELKLLADRGRVKSFLDAPAIRAAARNKGVVRRMEATYFDTPDNALEEAGYTLRVRRRGRSCHMTVKSSGPVDGNALARREWEVAVDGMVPDLARLAELPEAVTDAAASGPLAPLYTTAVRRHTMMLDLPDATVELAADEGTIAAGGRTVPIDEIELELKDGEPAALYRLALALCDHGRLDPSPRSKSARGVDLMRDVPPSYAKAGKLGLSSSITLDEAINAITRAALAHLLDNKAAAEDGRHPEGVHQVRVSLRRLRALLKMLAAHTRSYELERLRQEAKWLASSLDDARNWDVFLSETLPMVEAAVASGVDFAPLRAAAEAERAAAYEGVRAALGDPRSGRFQLELALWIEERGWRSAVDAEGLAQLSGRARDFADIVLGKLHKKVLKRGRGFAGLDAEHRHRVRLAMKSLRYMADFFLPLFGSGRRVTAYGKFLSRFQDQLGHLNDVRTTDTLVAALEARHGAEAFAKPVGAILGFQAHRMVSSEGDLVEAWRAFKDAGRLWKH
ncbi:CYTH and CHAD domain-containing protein [Acuticoccus kandeliae]|uniref:CYTH and CHAD domain-containing protein n=1 Tax=Acuticoccus kandeliae TaxID=2073160 RepID=UPI0014741E9D|nr:CYTH and CHAD domain-containing protein [Acuticoccus kandeliae]